MMHSACEKRAAAAIEAQLPEAEMVGPAWRLPLASGPDALVITARVEDTWLLLDASLEPALDSFPHARSLWALLDANAQPRGGVKLALLGEDSGLHARAELPLDVGGDLAARLAAAGQGYRAAAASACGDLAPVLDTASGSGPPATAEPVESSEAVAVGELSRLCQDAGWVFTAHSSERLKLDLEVGDRFYQAKLERRAEGGLALVADIDGCNPAADVCGRAMAIFLLRVNGWLRMIRAAAEISGTGLLPRFEMVFELDPTPEELSEALSALSVAVRFGAAELRVLAGSPEVARSYLARQPALIAELGSSTSTSTKKKRKRREREED
jgi:hypothetical protein